MGKKQPTIVFVDFPQSLLIGFHSCPMTIIATDSSSVRGSALSIVLSLLLIFGYAVAGLAAEPEASVDAGNLPYTVTAGDVLEISVLGEDGLTREVLVEPDGRINFPLAGTVDVRGQSVTSIREQLVRKLSAYISEPVVNVAVVKNQGNSIFVVGQVDRPGQYFVFRNIDVLQALSLAGGLTPFAKEDEIKVLRRQGGGMQTFDFDYDDVINGENLQQNILLKAGDTVTVP